MQDAFGIERGEISKGLFTPVKGIRGGFVTRRFPGMTKSGKRQVAAQKKAKRDAATEQSKLEYRIAMGPNYGKRPHTDTSAYYKEKNARAMAERKARDARIMANQPSGRQRDPRYDARDR